MNELKFLEMLYATRTETDKYGWATFHACDYKISTNGVSYISSCRGRKYQLKTVASAIAPAIAAACAT